MAGEGIYRFADQIAAFAEHLDIAVGVVTERLALGIYRGVIEKTPVDTGRARAGWTMSIDGTAPIPPKVERSLSAKNSGPLIPPPPQDPGLVIDGTKPVFILNNVVYIGPLEDGHSIQAPAGMVKLTLLETYFEVDSILKA